MLRGVDTLDFGWDPSVGLCNDCWADLAREGRGRLSPDNEQWHFYTWLRKFHLRLFFILFSALFSVCPFFKVPSARWAAVETRPKPGPSQGCRCPCLTSGPRTGPSSPSGPSPGLVPSAEQPSRAPGPLFLAMRVWCLGFCPPETKIRVIARFFGPWDGFQLHAVH